MSGGRNCYPDSDVLINKYNIRDKEMLEKFEIQKVFAKLLGLDVKPTRVSYTYNVVHLVNIHKYLFGDIYEWAGSVRSVNISKGNQFCRCELIEEQMSQIMGKLADENYLYGLDKEKLAERLAYYIGEINAIHPFREGNGRSQRMFIEVLALRNRYHLDFALISNEEMLEASMQTFNLKYELMTALLLRAMNKY